MEKKLTVRTTEEVVKAVKYRCLELDITVQEYINSLILKDLKDNKGETKWTLKNFKWNQQELWTEI